MTNFEWTHFLVDSKTYFSLIVFMHWKNITCRNNVWIMQETESLKQRKLFPLKEKKSLYLLKKQPIFKRKEKFTHLKRSSFSPKEKTSFIYLKKSFSDKKISHACLIKLILSPKKILLIPAHKKLGF